MLDTNICSFLIRKKPEYLLNKLQKAYHERLGGGNLKEIIALLKNNRN